MTLLSKAVDQGSFFRPDHRIFVLCGNASYSNRRNEEGYQGFIDLDAVHDDLRNMQDGLKENFGA